MQGLLQLCGLSPDYDVPLPHPQLVVNIHYLTTIKTKMLQSASFSSEPGFQIPEEKISRRDLSSPAATSGTVSWTDGNQIFTHQLVSGPILLGSE